MLITGDRGLGSVPLVIPSQPGPSLGRLGLHQLLPRGRDTSPDLVVGLVTVGAGARQDCFPHPGCPTQDNDQPVAGSRIWPYNNWSVGLAGMPKGAGANLWG